jgi:hypothetical protein
MPLKNNRFDPSHSHPITDQTHLYTCRKEILKDTQERMRWIQVPLHVHVDTKGQSTRYFTFLSSSVWVDKKAPRRSQQHRLSRVHNRLSYGLPHLTSAHSPSVLSLPTPACISLRDEFLDLLQLTDPARLYRLEDAPLLLPQDLEIIVQALMPRIQDEDLEG